MMHRRHFLALTGLGLLGVVAYRSWPSAGLWNPCLESPVPQRLLREPVVQEAWEAVGHQAVWDCHVHVLGTGDSSSGVWLNPAMDSLLHPVQYIQKRFFLNAACVHEAGQVDRAYIDQLAHMYGDFPAGVRLMLLAFDYAYNTKGGRIVEKSAMHVPNDYVARLAAEHEERLEWITSIHPYRGDGIEALDRAVEQGARAVKWLPSAMGIDPSSSLCDRFYKRLAQYDLPLLTHAGDEQAVAGVDDQRLNNPLLLRRALDHGVRVIVAHCATMGVNRDVDRGPDGPESENFSFFERMMDEPRYENVLFGDISGITQINRIGRPLKTLLSRREWHKRLLYGSDHPLPGVMPMFSMPQMVSAGFISDHDARILSELRRHNPMLFAFALARRLQWQGQRFSREVFETRRFFTREA